MRRRGTHLFCRPVWLSRTRSTMRMRVSSGQIVARMGESGRYQPTKAPQRTVARPRIMKRTCHDLMVGLSMNETPYASRPPTMLRRRTKG